MKKITQFIAFQKVNFNECVADLNSWLISNSVIVNEFSVTYSINDGYTIFISYFSYITD